MHRRLINILLVPFLAIATVSLLWLLLQQPLVLTESSQQDLPSIASITPEVQTTPMTALAARVGASHTASIAITKTVGLDPHSCAVGKAITVSAGTDVVYCYQIRNSGTVTLTTHTVIDDQFDRLLLDQKIITLPPGLESNVEALFTASIPVDVSSINTATWIASNGAISTTATDSTSVLVPSISITHTVGRNPNVCASDGIVNVPKGANVTHCYQVHNVGAVALRLHTVIDSRLGPIALDWPYLLAPGASTSVTATGVATETTTDVVTWTARLSESIYALAIDAATVRVPAIRAQTTVGLTPDQCATTNAISATVGTEVIYCYLITNTGGVNLTRYEVNDLVFDGAPITFTHDLTANTSLFFTVTGPVTQSLVNTATWVVNTTEGFTTTSRDGAKVNALSKLEALVFYDVDQSTHKNDGERNEADIPIYLDRPAQERLTATTTAEGIATFMNLPNVVYTASVSSSGLPSGYIIADAANSQVLTLTAAGVYTIALPLFTPPGTDSDEDGIPDLVEGSRDSDGDGIPDYLDTTQMLYLALIDR